MTKVEAIKTYRFKDGTEVLLTGETTKSGNLNRTLYKKFKIADGVDSFEKIREKNTIRSLTGDLITKKRIVNGNVVEFAAINKSNVIKHIEIDDHSFKGFMDVNWGRLSNKTYMEIKKINDLTPMAKRFLKLLGSYIK